MDPRCIIIAPSEKTDGVWVHLKSYWGRDVCINETCQIRCTKDGVAFNSVYGPSKGPGERGSCFRALSCTGKISS